jgi:hypothetical protein
MRGVSIVVDVGPDPDELVARYEGGAPLAEVMTIGREHVGAIPRPAGNNDIDGTILKTSMCITPYYVYNAL